MNTIKVKNYSKVVEEQVASATITPGNLVVQAANLTVGLAGADAVKPVMVAVEDEFQGNGIDDTYASGVPVQVWIPYPGDVVNAIASAAIVVGASIAGAASGRVVTALAENETVIGTAITAAAAAGDRVQIRMK